MSLEAWGDEDPADTVCSVDGCPYRRRVGYDICQGHRDYTECLSCGAWYDDDQFCECAPGGDVGP